MYKFFTAWAGPYHIYCDLIEKYTFLNFRIYWWDPINDWSCELHADKGEYKKLTTENLEKEDINEDYYKVIQYITDHLKNTKQVIKEGIIRTEIFLHEENVKPGDILSELDNC